VAWGALISIVMCAAQIAFLVGDFQDGETTMGGLSRPDVYARSEDPVGFNLALLSQAAFALVLLGASVGGAYEWIASARSRSIPTEQDQASGEL
jgi:hypothetical protein